jgi:hypothetical protein
LDPIPQQSAALLLSGMLVFYLDTVWEGGGSNQVVISVWEGGVAVHNHVGAGKASDTGQGRAGQYRAGQVRAVQGGPTAVQGRAGQGSTGQVIQGGVLKYV